MTEKLYEYELVPFASSLSGGELPRKYRLYRFTEAEAHAKNQAYALNHIGKRFVKVTDRDLNNKS